MRYSILLRLSLLCGPLTGCAPCDTDDGTQAPGASASELAPLYLRLPRPAFVHLPDIPRPLLAGLENARVESQSKRTRPLLMAPKGCQNLALNRPVTSSVEFPSIGFPRQITDGDKEGVEGSWVELGPGKPWVQIDLGHPAKIYAIVVWHCHAEPRIYKGVVVQVANDSRFSRCVRTVYNNDQTNAAGQGKGHDPYYLETFEGKLILVNGAKSRYIRLWTAGSTTADRNDYTEVEVWGLPG
jgi:hypothetical protein